MTKHLAIDSRNNARWLMVIATLLAAPLTVAAQPTPDPTAPTSDEPVPEAPLPGPEPTPVVVVEATPVVVVEAAPSAEKAKGAGSAGYDKGFYLKTDDDKFKLKITGRVQPFFTMTRTKGPAEYANAFEVRRARLSLEGNLHGKAIQYKFQSDFGKGVVTLKDFYADVVVGTDVWLRVGQWKRPFSRQQITSSGRQESTDRAITDKAFGGSRDIGIALRNDYEKSPELEWTIGVFNGFGDSSKLTGTVTVDPVTGMGTVTGGGLSNVPKRWKPAIVARVGINRNGMKGYSEADLEGGPMRFGAAVSVAAEGDFDDDHKSNQKVEADYIVKANGFSTTGGFYAMTDQKSDADSGVADAELSLVGFHVQVGHMLTKKWQAVARYALVNDSRTSDIVAKDQQEITVGGSYYGFGHDAKITGALRLIKSGDTAFTDVVLFELGTNLGW